MCIVGSATDTRFTLARRHSGRSGSTCARAPRLFSGSEAPAPRASTVMLLVQLQYQWSFAAHARARDT